MPPNLSMSSTHFAERILKRAPIHSMIRAARCSSPSLQAASTSVRSENRSANDAWGTDVSAVVRVVTLINDIQRCKSTTKTREICLGEAEKRTAEFEAVVGGRKMLAVQSGRASEAH